MAEPIKFYFDEHMPRAVEKALTDKGYDVIMAVDVEMTEKDDDTEHLPFAAENNAVLVTRDLAFAGRSAKHTNHAGVICWTGIQDDFGGMIRVLVEFAEQHALEDAAGNVFWLK